MIAYLRFKRARRLLHRYVIPGLCASAIALGGCYAPATALPSEPTEPVAIVTKTPITTLTAEPAIQVGDVDAVYVTLTTSRSIVVSQAYAVSESGGRIEPLKPGLAIEKAGGADKLLAALGDRGFKSVKVESEKVESEPKPERRTASTHCFMRTVFFISFMALGLPFFAALGGLNLGNATLTPEQAAERAAEDATKWAAAEKAEAEQAASEEAAYHKRISAPFSDEQKIEDEELLQVPYVLLTAEERKGYLLFPRGSYTALELPVEEADGVPVNGKLPTLMLRCLWR